jgi:hypothetical protein
MGDEAAAGAEVDRSPGPTGVSTSAPPPAEPESTAGARGSKASSVVAPNFAD